jgi:hypothetical protein
MKENVPIPIVFQVTQVPLGFYGRADKTATICTPFREHKKYLSNYINCMIADFKLPYIDAI